MNVRPRIVERPAFTIIGKKTWISGQDNALFARFWTACQAEGLFERLQEISGFRAGPQTGGATLGVSCVEADPSNRAFYYFIAVEKPDEYSGSDLQTYSLETHSVPAATWAVFECVGPVPEALVAAEIFAFTEWLPNSGYVHAYAPEMEVYPLSSDGHSEDSYCEFWLPISEPTST